MRYYVIGVLSALAMSFGLGYGPAQSDPIQQGASPTTQTEPAPTTPPSSLRSDEPRQILPPQTINSEAKVDRSTMVEPGKGITMSEFYNQDVYDAQDKKIGSVKDAVLDQSGQVKTVILGVGGVLGLGEKDVAAPFNAIQVKTKDGKHYLVMDTTKEALQDAPGYTYDRDLGQWVPVSKQPG
jgi:sporulation protein YlmC with PRC-barrel domain